MRIFAPMVRNSSRRWRLKMAHFLTNDEKYRDLIYGDDYRPYLAAPSNSSGGYKYGRTQGKRFGIHARRALRGVNGYLKSVVEAIANAKRRRMVSREATSNRDGVTEAADQRKHGRVGHRFVPVIEDDVERRLAPHGADDGAEDDGHPQ
jgi:hypothetical protein